MKAWGSEDDRISRELALTIIASCTKETFDALIQVVGLEEALRAIRPHSRHAGLAIARNGKNRFGLEGKGVRDAAIPFFWLHTALSCGQYKEIEVREGGAVVEIYSCPLANVGARPEICIAISHYAVEALCESMDDRLECVFTHHLTNGDGRDRYVIRRKGDKHAIDDLGQLLETVPMELTSEEERDLGLHVIASSMIFFMRAALDLEVQDQVLQIALPRLVERGKEIGGTLIERKGWRSAPSIERVLRYCSGALSQQMKVSGEGEVSLRGQVDSCPFQDAPPEVCAQIESVFQGILLALDERFDFHYGRMMSRGDPVCEWRVEWISTAESDQIHMAVKASTERVEDDPVRLLSLMLVKGEISPEDYEKKMALLKKYGR
jgi:hypothetical protein